MDKILIVSSATAGGISISFASVIGTPTGIASASLTLGFSLATGIIKKLLGMTRKKKKCMIRFLCWLEAKLIALRH